MSDVDLFLIQAQLDIDRAFSDVDTKSRYLYAQQRQLLFEHQDTLKQIEEQNKRGQENTQKHAKQTREELGYLAKQVEEVKHRLIEAFSIGAIEEFARRSIDGFAEFNRAMRVTQETLGKTESQMREMEEQLASLQAATGRYKGAFAGPQRDFNEGLKGMGVDVKELFTVSVMSQELLGAKITDMNAIIQTQIRNLKRPVEEVEADMSYLTHTIQGTGAAFTSMMPQIQRSTDVMGLSGKDLLKTFDDLFRIVNQGFGGDQQAAMQQVTSIYQKYLTDPKFGIEIEKIKSSGGGAKEVWDKIIERTREYLKHPDLMLKQGFTTDQIEALKLIEANGTKAIDTNTNVGKSFESVSKQFMRSVDDPLGRLNALKGAAIETKDAAGSLFTTLGQPVFEKMTRDILDAQKLLDDVNSKLPKPGGSGAPAPPGLAEGGVVTKPTMAMIGEKGPEAVIPIADIQRAQARDEAEMSRSQSEQAQKEQAESATTERLHQLALMGMDRRAPFRDWDDMLKGQDVGGGGGGGGGPGGSGRGPGGSGRGPSDSATPKDPKPDDVKAGGPGAGGPKGPVDKDGKPLFPTPEQHPESAAGIPGLPGTPSGPALTPEQRKAAAQPGGTTTAGWQPDLQTKKGMIGPRNEAQSDYLRAVRKPAADEIAKDPQLRAMLRGIGHAEDGKDPAAPLEALLGRWQYEREHGHPTVTLRSMLERTGRNQFFNPIRQGQLNANIAAANRDQKRFDDAIDYVTGGSNRLRGYYDQGGFGDPNFAYHVLEEGEYEPPRGARGREGYGPWPPGPDSASKKAWRDAQQEKIRTGRSTTVGGNPPSTPPTHLPPIGPIAGAPGGPSGPTLTPEQRKALGADPSSGTPVSFAPGTPGSPMTGELWSGLGASRSAYGGLKAHSHKGFDVSAPEGTQIYAEGEGTVVKNEFQPGATGGIVTIRYADGTTAKYMHLSNWQQKGITPGATVKAGQVLALSGSSPAARASGPHLHVEYYDKNGRVIDPAARHGWGKTNPKGEGLRGRLTFAGLPGSYPAGTTREQAEAAAGGAKTKAVGRSDLAIDAQERRPLVFLHGMGYGRPSFRSLGTAEQIRAGIDADMTRVATARDQELYVIPASGDNPADQEKQLRAYLKLHPDADVEGFSAGGYTLRRLKKDFPRAHFTELGTGPGGKDARFPGVSHMKLPRAEAERAETERAKRDAAKQVKTAENTKPPAEKDPPPPPAPEAKKPDPVAHHAPHGPRKKMAGGGVVTSATDVTIGEAGPEAVVPLGDDYQKIMQELGAPIRPEIEAPRPPSQQRLYAAQRRASQQQEHWTSKAENRYQAWNSYGDIGPV